MTVKIVAEIGCNHMGEMKIAHEMIKVASSFSKCDYVKFQKRNVTELLSPEQYRAAHPNPANSYGNTYGAHREFLELSQDDHRQLKAWCEEEGIGYSTSVWDITSAREIAALQPDFIKIPSASNLHFEMLDYLADQFGGQIHLSVGMTNQREEDQIVELFSQHGRAKDLVLYSCTSGYPVPMEDICLLEISRLREKFGGVVADIGFSGHHNGISIDPSAYVLGAKWIERHYTLDRTWKGTDHAASLEPDGLRRLVRNVRAIEQALTYKPVEILDIEKVQRDKLKWHSRESENAATVGA